MSIKSLYKIIKIEIYIFTLCTAYIAPCVDYTLLFEENELVCSIVFGQPTWLGCLLLL